MKTILAALVAGVIGGGAVLGASAAGLIPMDGLVKRPPKHPSNVKEETTDIAANNEDSRALRNEIANLRKQLTEEATKRGKLESEILGLNIALKDKADKGLLDLKADKSDLAAVKGPAAVVEVDGSKISVREAVRAELVALEAEKLEKERQTKQEKRLKDLETFKVQIREGVPGLTQRFAQEAKLDDVKKAAVDNILIAHISVRADLASEREGLRIDGRPMENDTYKLRTDAQDQSTMSSLLTQVDEATAKGMLNLANRMIYRLGQESPRPEGLTRPDRPDRPERPERERPFGGPREMNPRDPGGNPREPRRRGGNTPDNG